MRLAQAQHMWLPLSSVTDRDLSDDRLFHLLRTSPVPQIMPPLLVVLIDVGQRCEFRLHGQGQVGRIGGHSAMVVRYWQ
jgi:hypothetical protein